MENKILKIILGLIVAIAILHTVAIYFYLYYELWWFDILMHFVGGFWTVLFFLWLLVFSGAFLLDVERKNPAILYFLATSFLVIVAAEMIGTIRGLGALIMEARTFYRTDTTMVGMLLIALFGFLLAKGLDRLERALLPWAVGLEEVER